MTITGTTSGEAMMRADRRSPQQKWRDMYEENERWYCDRMRQDLCNNLWGYNPGELDRWADDGGRA